MCTILVRLRDLKGESYANPSCGCIRVCRPLSVLLNLRSTRAYISAQVRLGHIYLLPQDVLDPAAVVDPFSSFLFQPSLPRNSLNLPSTLQYSQSSSSSSCSTHRRYRMDGVVRVMTEQSPEVLRFYHLKELACDATIASMFLILYDTILTMGQEIDLVWRSAWSPPKVAYIMNRYSSILFATSYLLTVLSGRRSNPRCMAIYQLSTWYGWCSLMMVQLVVQTWLFALYRKCRSILYALVAAYMCCGGLTFISIYMSMSRIHIVGHSPVCTALDVNVEVGPTYKDLVNVATHSTSVPTFVEATLLPALTYSIFIIGLLAYKAVTTYYTQCGRYSLATVLIRDSSICCFVIALVNVLNALLITVMPPVTIQAGVGFGIALPSIASSRMLLDLRDVDKKRGRMTDVQEVRVSEWETMFHLS